MLTRNHSGINTEKSLVKTIAGTILVLAALGGASQANAEIYEYASFEDLMPTSYSPQMANNYLNPVLTENSVSTTRKDIEFGFFNEYNGGLAVSGFLKQVFADAGFPEYLEGNFDYNFIGAGNSPIWSWAIDDTNQNGIRLKYNTETGVLYSDEGDMSWMDNKIQYNGIVGVADSSIVMPDTIGGTLEIPEVNLVPEPLTLSLLSLGAIALLRRTSRRKRI